MSSEIAIKVEHLSKCYQIYEQPRDRLKQFILPRLQRLAGQVPNRYFREFWALRDVSFEVRKGETVGIIGRNGSGKSTLLQMICGTLNPTSGSIQTSGRIAALLELGSGFNPEFTGRENVYLNGAVLGLSEEEIDSRFESIAAFAEIGEFINQPVKTYSSGMMVRLAFAVQASVEPNVLIVDEALAVGDERFQRKCFSRLEDLKSKGVSILFVSHSNSHIIELCDRAFMLEDGECLMQSLPSDVVRAYQRMIYAPSDERALLVNLLKRGQSLACVDQGQSVDEASRSQALEQRAMNVFDPSLSPSSTIRYPENGARIDAFEIKDETGQRLNVLMPDRDYRIIVRGVCLAQLENVHFGIHIRSVAGLEITGQRFPEEGRVIELIEQGRRFEVTYQFNFSLLPGVYFVGGGVWAKEPICAHRVVDAVMFRVMPKNRSIAFGYCDLSSGEARLDLF